MPVYYSLCVDDSRPWRIDMPGLIRAAEAWLTELGIERWDELTALEQVELLVNAGDLPEGEWVARGCAVLGIEWDGVGPSPRWSRLGASGRGSGGRVRGVRRG